MADASPLPVLNAWLAAAAVIVPLALGIGAFVPRVARVVSAAAPLAALPALALALVGPADWVVSVPWLMLGARVGLDLTGRVFLLLGAITFSLAALAARSDADVARGPRHRFVAFLLVCAAGTIGMAIAQDAVTFYVAFALMSFPAYGLVVFDRRPESLRAGRAYIAFVIVGEVLLVTGLVIAVRAAGTIDLALLPDRMASSRSVYASVTLVLIAFAMKAGAVPLHVWLPSTYTQAPTPASAALAGVMSKMGVLGWLRFLPLGVVSLPMFGLVTLAAGLVATFYGVVVGLTQRNPKTVLAYSSVSQMGFITAAIGLGLLARSTWPLLLVAVLAYTLHHGLAKGALFLGTPVRPRSRSGVNPKVNPGLNWGQLLGLGVGGLSLAGAPLTSGALAKTLLKAGFAATEMPSIGSVITLMSVAAVGTTLLVARFLMLVWTRMREDAAISSDSPGRFRSAPFALATAVSILSPWMLMRGLAEPGAVFTLATAWPVVVGLLVSALAVAAGNRGWHPPVPYVPAGDLLVSAEGAARAAVRAGRTAGRACARIVAVSAGLVPFDPGETRAWGALSYVESRLVVWRAFGVLFVGIVFVVLLFTLTR